MSQNWCDFCEKVFQPGEGRVSGPDGAYHPRCLSVQATAKRRADEAKSASPPHPEAIREDGGAIVYPCDQCGKPFDDRDPSRSTPATIRLHFHCVVDWNRANGLPVVTHVGGVHLHWLESKPTPDPCKVELLPGDGISVRIPVGGKMSAEDIDKLTAWSRRHGISSAEPEASKAQPRVALVSICRYCGLPIESGRAVGSSFDEPGVFHIACIVAAENAKPSEANPAPAEPEAKASPKVRDLTIGIRLDDSKAREAIRGIVREMIDEALANRVVNCKACREPIAPGEPTSISSDGRIRHVECQKIIDRFIQEKRDREAKAKPDAEPTQR